MPDHSTKIVMVMWTVYLRIDREEEDWSMVISCAVIVFDITQYKHAIDYDRVRLSINIM